MTHEEAVNVAITIMDTVRLNGSDSRARGMAQAELMKAIPIIKAHNEKEAKKNKNG